MTIATVGQSADIHCGGYESCQDITITGAFNLVCSGGYGCIYSRISNIVNIFATENGGIADASVDNVTRDVFCIAAVSCHGAILNEIGGNVYGFGSWVLRSANIPT